MPTRKTKLTFMQPITRVHNIFRIRTIVNATTGMNKRRRFPSDVQIAEVLSELGLSKLRRHKMKDRIMRRARDHLLTASYMGLLTRVGRPFGYSSTHGGRYLESYKWGEECPKDEKEEAAFIDKIIRLKLTNVYDMQSGGQYKELRSRPVLFILYVLQRKNWSHEHQIAVATGGQRCDPLLIDADSSSTLEKVARYTGATEEQLEKFYDDFGIRDEDRKNMTRNIRPLLDWCESLGIVTSKEVQGTPGRWWTLSLRGKRILELYKSMIPIWYQDLGDFPSVKAAILIFYQYAKRLNLVFDERFLRLEFQAGVVNVRMSKMVQELEDLGIKFTGHVQLESELDFTLEYDVPPEQRDEVLAYVRIIARSVHLKPEDILISTETSVIERLKTSLESERQTLREMETERFARRTKITSDPIITKVRELIPSTGVLGQYKSDFEKEVAILLRLVGLNAMKYQGQLADRCQKQYVMRFFENNPDILILNGIESLVECKSTGEWHSPLSGEKSVPKEIVIYQQYFPEVKSDSIVLIYEGALDAESKEFLLGLLNDAKDVVFVNKNFLINCVHKPAHRGRFVMTIKKPEGLNAESRLLLA